MTRSPTRYRDLPGPRGLPLLGSAFAFAPGEFHRQLERWSERYGPVFRVRMGPSRLLVQSGQERVSAVLRDRPAAFSRVRRMRRIAAEIGVREGVFASEGDAWRVQRSMVTTAFNPANVRRWTPELLAVVERLRVRWDQAAEAGDRIDLQADLMRFTIDVVAGLALGVDVDMLGSGEHPLQQDLDRIFPALFGRAMAPLPLWRWYRSADDRLLGKSMRRVNDRIDALVRSARARLVAEPKRRATPANLLEAMIVASEAGAIGLDDEIVAGNVMTMLLAGEDTTANTLAWTIHFLAGHPKIMARARAEIASIVPADGALDLAVLERLDYLEACALESLRLKPVAPILPVEAVSDTVVDGVAIAAGTIVVNLMRRDATDPDQVAKPESFLPERWLDEPGVSPMPRRLSMPFGAGPRLCPGRWLALLEVRAVLAMLLWHFDPIVVETADGQAPAEHLAFTMAPVGLGMRLRSRGERSRLRG